MAPSATSRSRALLLPGAGREGRDLDETWKAVDCHDTLIAPARAPAHRLDDGPPAIGAARAAADRTVLDRYLLLERLGAGGFGVVWRAHDELLSREVAVKIISLPAAEDRERATREALATARLAHPAIVALYEACAQDDTFYLISELVPGSTLAQLTASEALCDEQVLEIGVALAEALLHAHERGVVHRDIKPQNVLVSVAHDRVASPAGGNRRQPIAEPPPSRSPTPPAKLTDFGGALLAGEQTLTRTGDVIGTLAYMAPEQIEGGEVTEAADLYSLALVLYEALSGVNPVRGPTPAATARRIGGELPRLERYRRDLPRALTRAVDAALDPYPERRGTLSELRDALTRADATAGHAEHHAIAEHAADEAPAAEQAARTGWPTPPRLAWIAGAFALCVWLILTGRGTAALAAPCAALPLVLLVRRPGPHWLAAALAPLLGLAGLAAAFPALAGQAARWRARALLGALGYWWLRLAELSRSSPHAAPHAVISLLGVALLLGAGLWALAAVLLPWLVRGRSASRDALAAALWAGTLVAAAPLFERWLPSVHGALPSPPGVILGAVLGAVIAVVARALRGPVGTTIA